MCLMSHESRPSQVSRSSHLSRGSGSCRESSRGSPGPRSRMNLAPHRDNTQPTENGSRSPILSDRAGNTGLGIWITPRRRVWGHGLRDRAGLVPFLHWDNVKTPQRGPHLVDFRRTRVCRRAVLALRGALKPRGSGEAHLLLHRDNARAAENVPRGGAPWRGDTVEVA
jgi:hypothetical protein